MWETQDPHRLAQKIFAYTSQHKILSCFSKKTVYHFATRLKLPLKKKTGSLRAFLRPLRPTEAESSAKFSFRPEFPHT